MSARKTNLSFASLTLAGVPLAKLRNITISGEPVTDDSRGIADAYPLDLTIGLTGRISAECAIGVADAGGAGNQLTSLDLSIFEFDGVNFVGSMRTGSLRITNDSDDGASINSVYPFANFLGRQIEITGELQIPTGTTGAVLTRRLLDPAGDRLGQVVIDFGEVAGGSEDHRITIAEAMIKTASHEVSGQAIQKERFTLVARQSVTTVTLPAGVTNSLISAALATDPVVEFTADTGANTYDLSGGATTRCFIDSLEIQWERYRITKMMLEMQIRGTFGESGTGITAPSS